NFFLKIWFRRDTDGVFKFCISDVGQRWLIFGSNRLWCCIECFSEILCAADFANQGSCVIGGAAPSESGSYACYAASLQTPESVHGKTGERTCCHTQEFKQN